MTAGEVVLGPLDDDPVGRVGERLHAVASGAGRIVEVVARARRLRPSDVHALVAVAAAERKGAPLTPGDLAQTLRLTTGAITGLIDRLVLSGHVDRVPDGADRRRVRVMCRPAGREVADELLRTLGDRASAVLIGLSADERRVVDGFLADVGFSTVAFLHTRDR